MVLSNSSTDWLAQSINAPQNFRAPLAELGGVKPSAPSWFEHAMAEQPERSMVLVAGAEIELLCWGKRGLPGLLLLHGNGGSADWWRFIAPFFSDRYRVAAFSWSGMGRSEWRDCYTQEGYSEEIFTCAQIAGLYESGQPPDAVGHSFGGAILAYAAGISGQRLRSATFLDSYFRPDDAAPVAKAPSGKSMPIYPDIESALARFRLIPMQSCEHLFIADHIARSSLRMNKDPEGWTWLFDPAQRTKLKWSPMTTHLASPQCPTAYILADRTKVVDETTRAFIYRSMPADSPWIVLPDCGHHVMVDQPLSLVSTLSALLGSWPTPIIRSDETAPCER